MTNDTENPFYTEPVDIPSYQDIPAVPPPEEKPEEGPINLVEKGKEMIVDLEELYASQLKYIMDQVKKLRKDLPEDLTQAGKYRGVIVGIRMDVTTLAIEVGVEHKNVASILKMIDAREKRRKAEIKQDISNKGGSLGKITIGDKALVQYNEEVDPEPIELLRARGEFLNKCLDELDRLDGSLREISISIGTAMKAQNGPEKPSGPPRGQGWG